MAQVLSQGKPFPRLVRLLAIVRRVNPRQPKPQPDPRWKHRAGSVRLELILAVLCVLPALAVAVALAGRLDMPPAELEPIPIEQAAEHDSGCCGGFDEVPVVGVPCTFDYHFVFHRVWITLPITTLCPPGFKCKAGTVDVLPDGWHHVTPACYNPKRTPMKRIFPLRIDFDDDDMKTASHNGGQNNG